METNNDIINRLFKTNDYERKQDELNCLKQIKDLLELHHFSEDDKIMYQVKKTIEERKKQLSPLSDFERGFFTAMFLVRNINNKIDFTYFNEINKLFSFKIKEMLEQSIEIETDEDVKKRLEEINIKIKDGKYKNYLPSLFKGPVFPISDTDEEKREALAFGEDISFLVKLINKDNINNESIHELIDGQWVKKTETDRT